MILEDMALQYCKDVLSGKEITTDEMKLQCQITLDDLEKQKDDDFPYMIDHDFLETVEGLLEIMNYATGIDGVIGQPIISRLHGFQAYYFYNVFGWKFKDNLCKYRWRDITLFIARKNAKSWLSGVTLIIFLLTEDNYSEFYSICLTKELAGEVKKAMAQTIEASPDIEKYFKVPKRLNGNLECLLTKSYYQPRVSEAGKNNSIRPSVFIADECGNFKTKDNINAMRSGQKNVVNAIQINTTTAYAQDNSIMFEEIDYIKKVLNKQVKNDRLFAMLYYSPKKHLWDDIGIYMANPLRIEDNYNTIREDRASALEKESEQEEYLTKSMNYFMPKYSGETYIDIRDLVKCKVDKIDWTGREVYIGLDLAMTGDNCSYGMVGYDKETNTILADSYAFIPKDRVEEKSRKERLKYNTYIEKGKCYSCGDRTVDYNFIEKIIMEVEEKFGVKVMGIGYDIYNCLSTAQKLKKEGYETVKVKQHSSILHAPTKLLSERILSKKFAYEENRLLEINFENAKCTYDTNLNRYVSKKLSYNNGKVDMVVSLLNALYLLQENVLLNEDGDWGIQVL